MRLALLSGHYRQPLNWTDDTIQQSKNILDRLYRVLKKYKDVKINKEELNNIPEKLLDALCDDLNTSKALAELNSISSQLSKANNNELVFYKTQLLAAANSLGILQHNPDSWLGYGEAQDNLDEQLIEQKILERNKARANKDFSLADQIRNELEEKGILIEDTSNGTIWRRK